MVHSLKNTLIFALIGTDSCITIINIRLQPTNTESFVKALQHLTEANDSTLQQVNIIMQHQWQVSQTAQMQQITFNFILRQIPSCKLLTEAQANEFI
jgi:hypothetical protein